MIKSKLAEDGFEDNFVCYAPVRADLGLTELESGYYACPSNSRYWIGRYCPRTLILLSRGEAEIYVVERIETRIDGEMDLLATTDTGKHRPVDWNAVLQTRKDSGYADEELTVFQLSHAGHPKIPSVVNQRGGRIITRYFEDALNADEWTRICDGKIEYK